MNSINLDDGALNSMPKFLHRGNYQLPVFSEYPEQKTPRINIEHFQKLERIPCASALIRLDYCTIDVNGRSISIDDPNPKTATEAYLPPPNYKKREYSTLFFPVTKSEKDLLQM